MKEIDWKKIEALRTYILEECKKQGFTVYEFEQFVAKLEFDLADRRNKIYYEMF